MHWKKVHKEDGPTESLSEDQHGLMLPALCPRRLTIKSNNILNPKSFKIYT